MHYIKASFFFPAFLRRRKEKEKKEDCLIMYALCRKTGEYLKKNIAAVSIKHVHACC